MPRMTVAQAAEYTGVNRTTITRAIKSGRMSATVLAGGKFAIDPAELERVFPSDSPQTTKRTNAKNSIALVQEDSVMRAQDARIRDLERQLEEYRERERHHREAENEFRAIIKNQTLLLSDQREVNAQKPTMTPRIPEPIIKPPAPEHTTVKPEKLAVPKPVKKLKKTKKKKGKK